MEHSVHEEPVKVKPAEGFGERIRIRISRQLESGEVVTRWNEAILRVVREACPYNTPQAHAESAKRWRLLAEGMGVAASVVDLTIAAAATGQGIRLFATRVGRWTPMEHERLIANFGQDKSPARQRVEHTLSNAARVSPLFGFAGATVALRPARFGLSLAGRVAGVAGENVTRIIRKITHSNAPVDLVYYGSS